MLGKACVLLVLARLACSDAAGCPFGHNTNEPLPPDRLLESTAVAGPSEPIDFDAVRNDIKVALTESMDFWPADDGNYGPFFIRYAWHCAGSYRTSDGRGGCDGGRIRFNPERSWDDNTNLDKANLLLRPIKLKYGDALSWGDLIILTGNTAIESMGGPKMGFCAGRIDSTDGYESLLLGPNKEQEEVAPCLPEDGACEDPLGPTTLGLIYVNPAGPFGNSDPVGSAADIRSSFARMGMNDRETVALIGGGHAFGKVHGACPLGPGPNPTEDPVNPWPGLCGSGPLMGRGPNTFTSGFEGSWTTTPSVWTNKYFTNLLDFVWEKEESPAGNIQWVPVLESADPDAVSVGPITTVDPPDTIMLTSDIALIVDDSYLELVREYAKDIESLEYDFAAAWYKLTTRDMGPVERCLGDDVLEPQDFQNPLPPPFTKNIDTREARKLIGALLSDSAHDALEPDRIDGKPYYGALFVNLAYQCASTFRATDYSGGCNGARIRFSPSKDWEENVAMDKVLEVLGTVREKMHKNISWSDLIVLAGQVALEEAGAPLPDFCVGRSDAEEGVGSVPQPRMDYPNIIIAVRDRMQMMGLTARQMVALAGRLRSPSQQARLGWRGSYTTDPSMLTNDLYVKLLTETWEPVDADAEFSDTEYKAVGKDIYLTPSDLALIWDPEFRAIVEEYAMHEEVFLYEFGNAWNVLVTADRFDGNTGNMCFGVDGGNY
ncbi:unnamed protein product [Choristocarpus tenellus]